MSYLFAVLSAFIFLLSAINSLKHHSKLNHFSLVLQARYLREDRGEDYKAMADVKAIIKEIDTLQKMNFERRCSIIKYTDPNLPANQDYQLPVAHKTPEENVYAMELERSKSSSDDSIMASESLLALNKSFVLPVSHIICDFNTICNI